MLREYKAPLVQEVILVIKVKLAPKAKMVPLEYKGAQENAG